jgi:hypothetical protein
MGRFVRFLLATGREAHSGPGYDRDGPGPGSESGLRLCAGLPLEARCVLSPSSLQELWRPVADVAQDGASGTVAPLGLEGGTGTMGMYGPSVLCALPVCVGWEPCHWQCAGMCRLRAWNAS